MTGKSEDVARALGVDLRWMAIEAVFEAVFEPSDGLFDIDANHLEALAPERAGGIMSNETKTELRVKAEDCLHMDNVSVTVSGDDWCQDCGAIAGGLYDDGQVSWWRLPDKEQQEETQ